jgi:hypothetical protein
MKLELHALIDREPDVASCGLSREMVCLQGDVLSDNSKAQNASILRRPALKTAGVGIDRCRSKTAELPSICAYRSCHSTAAHGSCEREAREDDNG